MNVKFAQIASQIFGKPLVFYFFNLTFTYFVGFLIALVFLNPEYKLYAIEVFFYILIAALVFGWGWKLGGGLGVKTVGFKSTQYFTYFFVCVFMICSFIIYSQNPPALLSGFFNTDLSASQLRALATKGKSGTDAVLNGLVFASSYVGIGMFSAYLFATRSKYTWILLILLTVLLMLNGQKSRFIIVLIPILVIYAREGRVRLILNFLLAGVVFILFVMSLYEINGLLFENQNATGYGFSAHDRLSFDDRNLFANMNSVKFIIHRLVWIPFITAIDWLIFIKTQLSGLLYGASIPLLSNLLGLDRINLDNMVFIFQFDKSFLSLGAANTFFAFDAMANFGLIGLLLIALVMGAIFRILWIGLPYPFSLVVFVWLYSFQSSSFHAILLGGGMLFALVFVICSNLFTGRR